MNRKYFAHYTFTQGNVQHSRGSKILVWTLLFRLVSLDPSPSARIENVTLVKIKISKPIRNIRSVSDQSPKRVMFYMQRARNPIKLICKENFPLQ